MSTRGLDKRALQSLDFAFNRFFMKLFKTTNVEVVQACREGFHCELRSVDRKIQEIYWVE